MGKKEKIIKGIFPIFMILCLIFPIFGEYVPVMISKAAVGPTTVTKLEGGTTQTLSSGLYYVADDVSYINTSTGGSGLAIASGATVYIYIPEGKTLTAKGANGSGTIGGGAGILVPSNSTLIFLGAGTVSATGGNAGNGSSGSSGGSSSISGSNKTYTAASGGSGGNGGGGAGAGIGTSGGRGGYGSGSGGSSRSANTDTSRSGNSGYAGASGSSSASMGSLYAQTGVTINAKGGTYGSAGGAGSKGSNAGGNSYTTDGEYRGISGGAGGGGGGAGKAGADIGTGGGGGGQGGGGGNAGYVWAGCFIGAGGGGGGAGAVTGTGGYCSTSQKYGTKDSKRDCSLSYSATNGSGTSGGQGAHGGVMAASSKVWTDAYGGSGGSGGSAGSSATSKSAAELTEDKYLSYTVTFEGADDNGQQNYYFAQGNTITVPEYTPAEGYTLIGWKVTSAASTLSTQSRIRSMDSSLLAEDTTYYQPGDTIVLGTETYGNVTLKPVVIISNDNIDYWQTLDTDSGNPLFNTADKQIQAVSLTDDEWGVKSVQESSDGKVSRAVFTNMSNPTSLEIKLQDDISMEGIEISVYQILSITAQNTDGTYSYVLADEKLRPFFAEYFQTGGVYPNDGMIISLLKTLQTNKDMSNFTNALKIFIDTENSDGDSDYITPAAQDTGVKDQYNMAMDISREYTYENGKEAYLKGRGYYFIVRSDAIDDTYTLMVIDEPHTVITLKGSSLSIQKSGDQIVMKVGDRVKYTLESKMMNTFGNQDYQYVICDLLENTMSPDMNSFEVYVIDNTLSKEKLTEGIDYTVQKTAINIEGEETEVIQITCLFGENSVFYGDSHMGDTILVNYEAEMTKTATSGIKTGNENYNRAWVEYGKSDDINKTEERVWDVYTIGLKIHKTDESGIALEGAQFTLYEASDNQKKSPLKFSKHEAGYYYYDSTNGDSILITDADGTIDIHGLNEDSLILSEVKAPDGYQAIDDQVITVVVSENEQQDKFVDLQASTTADLLTYIKTDLQEGYIMLSIKDPIKGSDNLPATGGKGRVFVYVVGSVLLIGAGMAFVVSRRRSRL